MISKIVEVKELINRIAPLRRSGKQVVFTNGCFDIMHAGHVRYLAAARSEGEILIVGINSDKSVKSIKGKNRPIVYQDQRAEVLAGLWCVDYIVFFDEPDPLRLIQAIKPDVLVKGEDWDEDKIIGADFVKADGGKVVRVAVVPDISTSMIIKRIISVYS
ncbi:MAG: D-glycero-beta-D-manno-heptose 1-phosphate adenylyltransferase [Thermodesulfobacteriota bacterium]|nr:D-glycero-beta-D-manno-heptose 1-phosphate adenylyltransferase [Thermodesulfobacteriota bacterium]